MKRIDMHTHSTFSHDGNAALADMVCAAHKADLLCYGISEHFDYECAALGVTAHGKPLRQIDAQSYFAEARRLQAQYPRFLAGCEFGYADNAAALQAYCDAVERYQPDFIVNSVHVCGNQDCYFAEYFAGKPKRRAYGEYLACVRRSLNAPYPYDIVGHIGYVVRNAPYEEKALRYGDFAEQIDDILTTIVKKDVILEVNTSTRGTNSAFLPDGDVLARYYEIGGRAISFASDAHDTARICDKFEPTVSVLRSIGFTHFTVPCRKERFLVPFD